MALQALKAWFTGAAPLPAQFDAVPWRDLPLLAIDLELTSLDHEHTKILSIGWVSGRGSQISLGSCFYDVVYCPDGLNQSPVIHGLIEEDIVKGRSIRAVINELVPFAESHVWVFHNANLDMAALGRAMQKLDIPRPTICTLDTLLLEKYMLDKQHAALAPNALTLTMCRQRHELPLAPAHNALDDAMATLELVYSQLHQLDAQGHSTLNDFRHTRAVAVHN